ncbi:hypothetical protein BYT27DRAFT_7250107 [Phlegmacium glaucopus]|nr:hypothetical protein BYT27DRAFT_7250107 [Phlegmacium glaucopus]
MKTGLYKQEANLVDEETQSRNLYSKTQGHSRGFDHQAQVRRSGNAGGGDGGERARTGRTQEQSTNKTSSRRHRSNINPSQPSLEAEASIAAIWANAERENLCIQLQLKAVEKEL